MVSSSANSPSPSGSPPLAGEPSSSGGSTGGRTLDSLSPNNTAASSVAESVLHGRSGTVVSSTFGSGRDYTFSHLHTQSGQVHNYQSSEVILSLFILM